MAPDSEQNDWIDQQLRRVTVPHDLVARLRRVAVGDDDVVIDAALRDVRVPIGLVERLQGSIACDDAWLDTELSRVAIPRQLVGRLQAISMGERWCVDSQLRDVTVPEGLIEHLQRIPQPVTQAARRRASLRRRNWGTLVVAASLLFLLGTSYLVAVAGFVRTAYRGTPEPVWTVWVQEPPIELQWEAGVPIELQLTTDDRPARREARQASMLLPGFVDAPPIEGLLTGLLAGGDVLASGPVAELNRRFGHSHDLLLRPISLVGTIPFAGRTQEVSQPHVVSQTVARGISQGWTDPHLLLPLFVDRAHPFVDPSAGSVLANSCVAVDASSASYEKAWDILEAFNRDDGQIARLRRKLARTIRTEEFVQAIDYGPSGNDDAPQVVALGGPSWYGEGNDQLLQVLVKTPKLLRRDAQTMDCIAVIDTSPAMHRDRAAADAWVAKVRRALGDMVDRLGPRDRISLIAAHAVPELLLRSTEVRHHEEVRAAIDALVLQTGTNLGEGLRDAATIAYDGLLADPNRNYSVVILSEDAGPIADQEARRIEAMIRKLQAAEIRFSIVNEGRPTGPGAVLVRFATAAEGSVVSADSTEAMARALVEAASGRSQVVASDATLTVTFRPGRVKSYRLLGHEANSPAGTFEASASQDLTAGRTAVGLFEVRLKREGAGEVARVDLRWRDPRTGRAREAHVSIEGTEFSSSFSDASPALQAATVLAEAGELLRGLPYAKRSRSSLTLVRSRSLQVESLMQKQPSFQRFIRFLDRAIEAGLR